MKKTCIVAALAIAIASCGNNPSQDKPMYDSTANAPAGLGASRDSATAAAARDSSANDSSKSSTQAGASGNLPKGTIDSGMTNKGAHKTLKTPHKKK